MAHDVAMKLDVRPLSGAIGAEILGVDLARDLDEATVRAVRQVWLEHLVVFFRDQDLSPVQFRALAARFGQPVPYPFLKGIDGFPEVTPVVKLEHETVNFGGIWHSDTGYLECPPTGTFLIAREVPPVGGDTLFANQYLAYEALSDGLRRVLEPLHGVNESAKAKATRTREDRPAEGDAARRDLVAEHPVVRTHPETGRKALYVNSGHTTRFSGMTEAESRPILEFLFQHQVKPEFTCRFRWRPGSIALWDNRCAQHNPVNDYHGYRRIMHRVTLAGDKPR